MNYVLIDYENVHLKSLALLKGEQFQVRVFLGPKNTRLPTELVLAMHELGKQAKYITLESSGANALDFHIAYYLGELATVDPAGLFHIISKDTGFDQLIKHLKTRNISVERSVSIEMMPCFAPSQSSVSKPKAAAPKHKHKTGSSHLPEVQLIDKAIADLIKRKTARPSTTKTLMSTLHAKCGKELPASVIKAVYDDLVQRGYVIIEGKKVRYALPAAWP